MHFSHTLLALLLAQSMNTVLTTPHPGTNPYKDVGDAVTSPDVDTYLEGLPEPRRIAPRDESPSHAMTRRQTAQVINTYGQFYLPCNISAATVATAVKYVILLTLEIL